MCQQQTKQIHFFPCRSERLLYSEVIHRLSECDEECEAILRRLLPAGAFDMMEDIAAVHSKTFTTKSISDESVSVQHLCIVGLVSCLLS